MWQQPKTDWKPEDFFNVEDYNRIKGNLNEIRSQSLVLWPDFEFEDMGADKLNTEDSDDFGFYADEINRFEANVDHICNGTFSFPVGDRQTFYDNQPFIGADELNRIENACLMMYENIMGAARGRKMLAFTLNGGIF